MEFSIGDRVRCVDDTNMRDMLEKGNVYTVSHKRCINEIGLKEIEWHGIHPSWMASRFELVKEEQPKLDLSKPVQTRDGRPVRILATDVWGSAHPILGLVRQGTSEIVYSWRPDGTCPYTNDDLKTWDLVNVPPKPHQQTLYLYMHRSKRTGEIIVAKHHKGWTPNENELLAVKEVTITEGDGLSV